MSNKIVRPVLAALSANGLNIAEIGRSFHGYLLTWPHSCLRLVVWLRLWPFAGQPGRVYNKQRSASFDLYHNMTSLIYQSFSPLNRQENKLFTLESSSRSIVCYFHTFGNNLGIKGKFAKYFKESCCLSSDQHFSFKCFKKNAFVRKIFPKSSGLFWPLWV